MQSRNRRAKRLYMQPTGKSTSNRPGQLYRVQTIRLAKVALDANQKLHKTVFHVNSNAK